MRAIEKRLRDRIRQLETEKTNLIIDRIKFRDKVSSNLKWLIEIHGKGSRPDMNAYIECWAKFLSTVEKWYW